MIILICSIYFGFVYLPLLCITVKLLIRLAGLILFLRPKMRVSLEIAPFYLLNLNIIAGLIRIRVLLEGEPYQKLYGMYQIVWKISATPSVSLELCYYKDYFCLLVVRGCGGLDSYYKTAHSTELCSLFFLAHNGYRKNIQNYPWAISQLSGQTGNF